MREWCRLEQYSQESWKHTATPAGPRQQLDTVCMVGCLLLVRAGLEVFLQKVLSVRLAVPELVPDRSLI